MSPEHVPYEIQCIRALNLFLSGHTYREIAQHEDCSCSTAHNRVSDGLDQLRPHADADRYRARQLAELETARTLMLSVIIDDQRETMEALQATDRLIKIHEREAKLLGLDRAPTPLEEAARALAVATDVEIIAELEERTDE